MSGSTTRTGPTKTSGKWHSIKGSLKQGLGDAFHIRSLSRSGANEHAAGQTELTAGKVRGHAAGTKERVLGGKDQIVGAATGDYAQERAGHARSAKGERRQLWNRKV